MMRRLGNLIGFSAAVFVFGALIASEPVWTLVGCCLSAVLAFVAWALIRGQHRRRLIHDADVQHAAWLAGDDETAIFGGYFPVDGWDRGELVKPITVGDVVRNDPRVRSMIHAHARDEAMGTFGIYQPAWLDEPLDDAIRNFAG